MSEFSCKGVLCLTVPFSVYFTAVSRQTSSRFHSVASYAYFSCGSSDHVRSKCKLRNSVCSYCNLRGHIVRVCDNGGSKCHGFWRRVTSGTIIWRRWVVCVAWYSCNAKVWNFGTTKDWRQGLSEEVRPGPWWRGATGALATPTGSRGPLLCWSKIKTREFSVLFYSNSLIV